MSDCSNVEMREALPDLLQERLEAEKQRRLLAHLEVCADCRAELDVLRDAREALVSRAPRVNEQQILSAIAPYRASRRTTAFWQIAAAILILATGTATVGVLTRPHGNPQPNDTIASTHASSPELTMTGGLGDLDDADLKAILPEIDHLDAVPSSDPEPVGLSVGSPASSSGEN